MKPSKTRLKDVLDEQPRQNHWIVDKFLHLKARRENKNPPKVEARSKKTINKTMVLEFKKLWKEKMQ